MPALPSDVGGPTTTTLDHTRNSDGARLPSSPSPSIRAGIWRCAMPRAPRQLPSLQPPNRAIQPPGANSPLDKTWGQHQALTGKKASFGSQNTVQSIGKVSSEVPNPIVQRNHSSNPTAKNP